ncbi:MAG: PAS domain S-box protein [Desulfomonile tiedjei]|nr:PAS domain S-box protein [Desulfomonile tiedjei]
MAEHIESKPNVSPDLHVEPELLRQPPISTQSIILDSLFSKDLSDSGSFDFSRVKEASFGKLLEALPMPAFLIDSSLSIVFVNEASGKIAEDCAKIVGKKFFSLFPSPGESEKMESNLKRIFEDRVTTSHEGMLKIQSRLSWCRILFRSVRLKGYRSVLALVEDLSAEKRQLILNEKYQQLVQVFPIAIAEFTIEKPLAIDSAPSAMLSAISRARLLGGNHEFARLCGHTGVDSMKGKPLCELFPFGEAHSDYYRSWIAKRFPVISFETEEPNCSGSARYFENTLVGNVKVGHLFGLWGMRQDITQRKESEQALRTARDKLEERVKERTAELTETNEQLRMQIIERKRAETELAKLVIELQEALSKVKTLSGLLPICASCKKIRDDRGYWTQVEVYVRQHSEADFTHSICPECAAKLYPGLYDGGS